MRCERCGHDIQIGEWPFCEGIGNTHEKPSPSKGFEAYLDENISDTPVMITNPGDRNKLMRPHWVNDHIVHVQERGKSDSYYRELNQRRAARAEKERSERR